MNTCAYVIQIGFSGCNVVLEVILVREVRSAFGEWVVVWVGVLGLEVEMEVAIDVEVKCVHVTANHASLSIQYGR